jgi:hypothetical protein
VENGEENMRYLITEHFRALFTLEVEAEDEYQAEELAEEILNRMAEEEFREHLVYERQTDVPLHIEEADE